MSNVITSNNSYPDNYVVAIAVFLLNLEALSKFRGNKNCTTISDELNSSYLFTDC